jgi:hypothetical protein
MPTRFRVALSCLYAVAFLSIAMMCLGFRITEWALAEYGLSLTLAGLAIWVVVLSGSIRLINKIYEDWPTLSLPPEPAYSPELPMESVLMAAQIDVRSVGSRAAQYPGTAKTEQMSEKC